MKKFILFLALITTIPLATRAQFESANNFSFPTLRTIHWQTGTTPPGAFPIWTTAGTKYFEINTDTVRFTKTVLTDKPMTYKLLWIHPNGDVWAWTPNYLIPADTTNKWLPIGTTIPSAQVNTDWTSISGVSQLLNKPDLSVYCLNTDTANRWYPRFANPSNYLTGITSSQVTTALGYTPTNKRIETYLGTTDGSGNYTVTYTTSFSTTPDVQPQLQAGTPSQVVRITASSTTGFTVNVTNRASVNLLGIDVLLATTTPVSAASVGVLVTSR